MLSAAFSTITTTYYPSPIVLFLDHQTFPHSHACVGVGVGVEVGVNVIVNVMVWVWVCVSIGVVV